MNSQQHLGMLLMRSLMVVSWASLSYWIVGAIWQEALMSHRFSARFSLGNNMSRRHSVSALIPQTVVLMPLSPRNCLHEPRAQCMHIRSTGNHLGSLKQSGCCWLSVERPVQGHASPDYNWPTAKPLMLDDLAGNITFTLSHGAGEISSQWIMLLNWTKWYYMLYYDHQVFP